MEETKDKVSEDTTSETTTLETTAANEIAGTVLSKVKELIKASNGTVEDSVVKLLADKEVDSRVEKVLKALEKHTTLENDLKKLTPDSEVFDVNNKAIQTGYTKERSKSRAGIQKQIKELSAALEFALKNGDYSKLNNLVQSGK